MITEKRIAIACFAGAALGALLALQFGYFWWVGILIGGAIGYVTFRFKEVIHATRIAWSSLLAAKVTGAGIKQSVLNVLGFLGVLLGLIGCAFSVLILSLGALAGLVAGPQGSPDWPVQSAPVQPTAVPQMVWMLAAAGALVSVLLLVFLVARSGNRKTACLAILGCVLATPLFLPITLLAAFAWTNVPRAGRLAFRLTRHIFILINSELRLLCMVDALLGALAGYFCGNAFIGGVIGALLGWLNYRFISVRWLATAKS